MFFISHSPIGQLVAPPDERIHIWANSELAEKNKFRRALRVADRESVLMDISGNKSDLTVASAEAQELLHSANLTLARYVLEQNGRCDFERFSDLVQDGNGRVANVALEAADGPR